ncbi:MAG: cytochrome-c oxidase, cbb3-type subunit II [Pseudomonadota bacterium]
MRITHRLFERHTPLFLGLIVVGFAIGGLVQIVPLHTIATTIEPVEGVRPYSPLEQAGRDIYIREGCYVCHSQMIRPFREEVDRYGHYSLAAESVYDHPFQWGSKRTGPDLARVGGKYSNQWHAAHLKDPQSVIPTSIMPAYGFLADREIDPESMAGHMRALRVVGVPYTDEQIEAVVEHIELQAGDPNVDGDIDTVREFYPKAAPGDFDGDPDRITEMDALIAYLQMLGTLVDFAQYDPERFKQ